MRSIATPRVAGSGWLVAPLLASLAAGACRDGPTGPHVEQFETPDVGLGPREVRSHPASGAELARPYGAWHFASAQELTAWAPDAVLGVADEAGTCWGWVALGTPGDGDPRRYSQSLLAAASTTTSRTDVNEYVLYANHTAHRWELEEPARGDQPAHGMRVSTLVEGPWRYTLWAHARGGDYRRRRRCLDEITSGFDARLPTKP